MTRLGELHNVSGNTLRGCMDGGGLMREQGSEIRKKEDPNYRTQPIDAGTLRAIARLGVDGIAQEGGLDAVATRFRVSTPQLRRLFNPVTGLTDKGNALLGNPIQQAAAAPVVPAAASHAIASADVAHTVTLEDLMAIPAPQFVGWEPESDPPPAKRARLGP